jgi:hypothetical protein
MGYQQFFRKPQLHRPCTPAAGQFPTGHHRPASFFLDRQRQQNAQDRADAAPAAEAVSPPPATPLLPLAAQLFTGLLVFITILLFFLLLRWR